MEVGTLAILGSVLGTFGVMLFRIILRQADCSQPFAFFMVPHLFIIVISLATITGFAATFVPALRAGKLDPMVAMRG